MGYHSSRYGVALVAAVVVLVFGIAWCDKANDREECAESLVGLATCLPYVGGTAKSPTADCCSGLKQMLNTNNKCLCVVIENRNDPDLGLTLNLTLALALPHTCNAPAVNISHCPVLLGLPPDSADAQIFYQLGQNSTNITSTNIDDKGSSDSTSVGSSGDEHENGGCGNWDTFMGLQLFVGLVFLWSCYF